ncbi:MAG: 30S ribosomal protein S13 [Planctomycetota bacterium]
MPRLVGVDVPGDKPIEIGLKYIFGVGRATSKVILKALEIEGTVRAKNLNEDQLSRIGSYIEKNYMIEGALRHHIGQKVSRLKEIRCYRGMRHRMGLPVRGQSTRSNARTRKGPRKTVAGKRSVKSMGH